MKIITPAAVDSSTTDRSAEKSLATLQTEAVGQPESPLKIQKKKEEVLDLSGFSKKDDTNEKEKNPRKNHEDLWASLGLSAGNYNPGSVSGSSLNSPTYGYPGGLGSSPSVSRPGVGSSYSVGLAMGKRVANRWVIQGGISYLNSSSGYTSNMTSSSFSNPPQAFDLYNASVKTSTAVTFTNPYQINSVLEFISIPVQAGYLLVDKKMGFQMNAGVATDFFIRNSLQDQSGQVNSYSQSAGSDSPYRSVNWAGLVSTELSYKVGRQYRISLVPGVRYWFNSSLKSGATSNSYMADLGFRFRYILK